METRGTLTRRIQIALLVLLTAIAVASLLTAPPAPASNVPLFLSGAQVDSTVRSILERSCQDCHSENTQYPWYSYVAPVSWLIRSDVTRGRQHLNLSRWEEYAPLRKQRCLSEIANQIKDREMPLAQYTWIHRHARLSEADVNSVFQWTQRERARLIALNSSTAR